MRTIAFGGQRLDWCDGSEDVVDLDFLGPEGMEMFLRLIRLRRSLPVYLGGCWRCYECAFEAADLAAVAAHVVRAHRPAPLDEDEEADPCERAGQSGAA